MATPARNSADLTGTRTAAVLGWVHVALLVGFYGLAALTYGDAPPKLPVHFDISGTPNRWAETTFLTWFSLPLLATGLWLLATGIGALTDWLVRRHPQWINIPKKEAFLRLDEAQRVWVLAPMTVFLRGIFVAATLLFIQIFIGTLRVADGRAEQFMPIGPIVFVVLVLGGVITLIVTVHGRIGSISAGS